MSRGFYLLFVILSPRRLTRFVSIVLHGLYFCDSLRCCQDGVYLYGRVRRTDWLPVDGSGEEQLFRSSDSESDGEADEQDREPEDLYSDDGSSSCGSDPDEHDRAMSLDFVPDLSDAEDEEPHILAESLIDSTTAGPDDLGGLL